MDAKEILGFIMILALVGILGTVTLYISEKVDDKTALNAGDYATGTYNFTGVGITGEYVNITNSTGSTMCYYVNTTGIGKPVGCLVLRADGGANPNTSVGLATQLKTQLAADSDINSSITVTNTTTTNVIVTWNTKGTAGNVATTDTVVNGSWTTGATLTGGVNTDTYYDASQNIVASVETGYDFTEIVIIAAAAALIIAAIFGVIGGYIKL